MGARELHIVDVFDTDGKGRTKKPFGRETSLNEVQAALRQMGTTPLRLARRLERYSRVQPSAGVRLMNGNAATYLQP
jgi:hypothetical protein